MCGCVYVGVCIPLHDELYNIRQQNIYMCIEGDVKISAGGFVQKLNKGETVLVPATLKAFKLITTGVKLLEIYI